MKEEFKNRNIYEETLQDLAQKSGFNTDSSNDYYKEK